MRDCKQKNTSEAVDSERSRKKNSRTQMVWSNNSKYQQHTRKRRTHILHINA